MLTNEKLSEAILEAERFIAKAQKAQLAIIDNKWAVYGSKETGAVRRASMDLTRTLAELRSGK